MPQMATAVETEPTRVGLNRLAKNGLLAVLSAVVATAIVRTIALSFISVPAGFWPLGWGPVLGSAAIGAIGATVVYGVLTRISSRPNRNFTIVAAIALVLSFGSFVAPPPVLADAPLSVVVVLAVLHVIVAVTSVGVLVQTSTAPREETA